MRETSRKKEKKRSSYHFTPDSMEMTPAFFVSQVKGMSGVSCRHHII